MAITTLFELTASSNMQSSSGVSPTVSRGGGTYTEENGYACNTGTILLWDINADYHLLTKNGYFEYEIYGRNNTGQGSEYDFGLSLRSNADQIIMTAVFANGYSDSGTINNEIFRVRNSNGTVYEYNGQASLDTHTNAWHSAKVRGYFKNGKWIKSEYFTDGELVGTYNVTDDCTFATYDANLKLRLEMFDNTAIKSAKVIFVLDSPSGGAGSGYIGNTLLSNKKMVGYNVPTSSDESTKTESVDEASTSPVSGKPKIGNGFAKIKFLREVQE